jgi:hypothetical protein
MKRMGDGFLSPGIIWTYCNEGGLDWWYSIQSSGEQPEYLDDNRVTGEIVKWDQLDTTSNISSCDLTRKKLSLTCAQLGMQGLYVSF